MVLYFRYLSCLDIEHETFATFLKLLPDQWIFAKPVQIILDALLDTK